MVSSDSPDSPDRTDESSTDETGITPQVEPVPTPLVTAGNIPIGAHPTIHLDDERACAVEANARRIAQHARGTPANHVTGLLGEDAVAQALGIAESLDVEVYADGGDGGIDLSYYGATIDVKTVDRHRSDPALTVDAYAPLTADYYVLASRVGPRDVRLIGYAPRQFVANAPTWSYEGRPYHVVDQEYLFPFPRSL